MSANALQEDIALKVGDIVKHILSDEVYRILKVDSTLAMTVCQHPPYSHKLGHTWIEHDRYICAAENLKPYPEGKFIFDWLDGNGGDKRYAKIIEKTVVKPGTQLSLI
jgi:hypothetical protein